MMTKNFNYVLFICCFVFFPCQVYSFSPPGVLEELQQEMKHILEVSGPSVVTISVLSSHSYQISKDSGILPFFKDTEKKVLSYKNICSGLIYNKDGFIITKSHFNDAAATIRVTLHDSSEYTPEYIGYDEVTGLAVLKINADNVKPAKIGHSKNVEAGNWATIVGNSMGVSPSVSLGIISKIYRDELFEISATINPGNSGSPVFDIEGNVIGIVVAQAYHTNGARISNMFNDGGVALPISKVCYVVENIIEDFKEQHPWLGIQVIPDSTNANNLVLNHVIVNSPAAKAGLRIGDILVKYNNKRIKSPQHLGELIQNTIPGTVVPVSFTRNNSLLNVFVTVGVKPRRFARDSRMKRVKPGNYSYAAQAPGIEHRPDDIMKIENEIKILEQQLFYLKNLINTQKAMKGE